MIESNINAIAVAAVFALPVVQSYNYVRYLLKDETYEEIKNGKFTVEVNNLIFS